MRTLLAPAVGLAAATLVATSSGADRPAARAYRSPYSVAFSYPVAELLHDLHDRRGAAREESSLPFSEWYSRRTRRRYGVWGPPARRYPAPRGVADRPLRWRRERVIAVGLRFRGYGYQHHHVPDWDPPADWPWKKTAVGHNGKGVDCSNFSAFVYNQGFGLKPISAIRQQAEQRDIPGPGPGRTTRARRIALPKSYAEVVKILKTGDLLFIRSRKGQVSHVVLWVGKIGVSPDGKPLILDSHGQSVKDCRGVHIPAGIHLRPFAEDSWYFRSASHAHRFLHEK
jgi:hypothetical protein